MAIGGNPRVVVDFVADTKSLSSGLRDAGDAADRAGGRLKKMGAAAVLAAGAAGLTALAVTAKVGFDELKEGAKVSAQTAAALKSTGGAAGVTATQVEDLASALSAKSGVDDEAIQSGQNLLLTFTNIRNEAGKGNRIFDQATATILDMSVALGQDMKGSAIQVGKALNDPVKGITALTRVGVTFTDGQKKTIKRLVETGRTLDAQKIILKELNKEFGGSAQAYGNTIPGQLDKLKNSFGNLAGEIIGVLVPALQAITGFATKHPKLFRIMVISVLALAAAMVTLNAALAITALVTAPLTGTILLVVGGIAALTAAVILAVKHWDSIQAAFESTLDWVKRNWPLLLTILLGPIGAAAALIITKWDAIESATKATWAAIRGAIATAINAVAGTIRSVWNGLVSFLAAVGGRIASAFDTVRSWLRRPGEWAQDAADGVRTAFNSVVTFLGNLGGRIHAAILTVQTWLAKPGEWAEDAVANVKSAFNSLVSFVAGLAARVAAPMASVASALKGPINSFIDGMNAVRFSVKIAGRSLPGPLPDIPGVSFTIDPFPHIPRLAQGGVIDSPTLALVGEAGREIVTPESLLRDIVGSGTPDVRVFIGDQELRAMVRYEVRRENDRTARTLLGGLRGGGLAAT